MNTLKIFSGTDLEQLYDPLLAVVKSPHPGRKDRLNCPETIVIQARGVDKWLTYRMARDLGVAANLAFALPARFFEERTAVLPGESLVGSTARMWSVATALSARQNQLPEPLGRYVETGHCRGDRILSLSQALGEVLDDRLHFDPSGKRSELDPFLAELLSDVVPDSELNVKAHPGALARKLWEDKLPLPFDGGRVILFGLSFLPEYQQRLIDALVRGGTQVYLFLLAPSDLWLADQQKSRVLSEDPLVNPLVALLGGLAKKQQASVDAWGKSVTALPQKEAAATLLGKVQQRMRALQGGADEASVGPDGSLEFHSCFGPLRQVEAVRLRLLQALSENPGLQPEDVVILTPDLPRYAPFVKAVFSRHSTDGKGHRIPPLPVTVAEQVSYDEEQWAPTVGDLLELLSGRFAWSTGVALLDRPLIRRSLGIDREQALTIQQLISDFGVRWGVDACHQKIWIGEDADGSFGWQQMWQRLALSAAGGEAGDSLWQGIEGDSGLESELIPVAARAAGLYLALGEAVRDARNTRSVAAWCDWLRSLLDQIFAQDDRDEDGEHATPASGALAALEEASAGTSLEISLERFAALLLTELEEGSAGNRFLRSGITVSRLAPLRSVPAKIIIMLGMDGGAFPRQDYDNSLGLLHWHRDMDPWRMPPSRRERDQQLFIETVLAAQEKLWIFYQGRTQKTQDTLQPCGPVTLLMDEAASLVRGRRADGQQDLLVEHPLHPFAEDYFEGRENRAALPPVYDHLWAQAANCRPLPGQQGYDLFVADTQLVPPTRAKLAGEGIVRVGDLRKALTQPWRWWLTSVLRLDLYADTVDGSDDEPDSIKGLPQWRMFDDMIRVKSPQRRQLLLTARYWRSQQILPPGRAGLDAFAAMREDYVALEQQLGSLSADVRTIDLMLVPPLAGGSSVHNDMDVTGLRLRGELDLMLDAEGRTCLLTQRKMNEKGKPNARGKDVIHWWLYHLLLCLSGEPELRILGANCVWRFADLEPDIARGHLRVLVDAYLDWHENIPSLLPHGAYCYVEKYHTAKDQGKDQARAAKDALVALTKTLPGGWGGYTPDFDDNVRWILAGRTGEDVLDFLGRERVIRTAQRIFEPLLSALRVDALS